MAYQCKCQEHAVCGSHLNKPCAIPRRRRNKSGLCHLCEQMAASLRAIVKR
jgi:hypothetical protein